MFYYGGGSRRVTFLDEFRGFVIVLMILFHLGYDLVYLFHVDVPFYLSAFVQRGVQPFIAISFTLISGVACRYSHDNIKRGSMVFAIACAMTAVTWFFMRDQVIWFGVLHMLGASMILFGIFERHKQRNKRADLLPTFWSMFICLALFILTYHFSDGIMGLPHISERFCFRLPDHLYRIIWLSPLGLRSPDFFSSDYFPLIPWIFLFFFGTSMGAIFRRNVMPEFFYRKHFRMLEWLGRHSLVVYVLHQPVTYGVLLLMFHLLGRFGVL